MKIKVIPQKRTTIKIKVISQDRTPQPIKLNIRETKQ